MANNVASRIARLNMKVPQELTAHVTPEGWWRGARYSNMTQARLRKRAMMYGNYGEHITSIQDGWNPLWDRKNKFHVPRPPKGHKLERNVNERMEKIVKNLKEMDGKVAKYRESILARKKTPQWTDAATKEFMWEEPVGYKLQIKRSKAAQKKK